MTCTNSINSINSITESTDNEEDSYTSMDNICTQCINFQQKQKQIEIELERIYNRNNELEDKIIEIQTNDSIYNRPSIYNKSKTMTCTNSINSINSITESTDNEEDSLLYNESMDNICTQCINFQQKQKQIEIELERIYN
eukprot:69317_1